MTGSKSQGDESEPIEVIVGSRAGSSSGFSREELSVFEDRVEGRRAGFMRGSNQVIRFEQLAQVVVVRSPLWWSLHVESAGGLAITVGGLKRQRAEEAKAVIERAAAEAQRRTAPSKERSDFGEQIRRLGGLRDEGLLTDAEFELKKKELLDRM